MQDAYLHARKTGGKHPWGNETLPTATAIEDFIERLVVDAVWEDRLLDLRALEAKGIFPW